MNTSDRIGKAAFSLFSGDSGENPFPLFAQIREMGSVIFRSPVFGFQT